MKVKKIQMPEVSRCEIGECAYNIKNNCHAKAITVGDGNRARCDTYFISANHTSQIEQIAGVGACKVANCRHNKDFECVADNIMVGMRKDEVNCLSLKL